MRIPPRIAAVVSTLPVLAVTVLGATHPANATPGAPSGIAVTAKAAAATPLPQQAAPPGFASWAEVAALQAKLHDAAIRISSVADSAAVSGLGSIHADPEDRAVRVYWKGDLPPGVAAVIGQA